MSYSFVVLKILKFLWESSFMLKVSVLMFNMKFLSLFHQSLKHSKQTRAQPKLTVNK